MLAPSGGGLILYQAYGNIYAMKGRKAHLLDDKQIPSVGVFDEVFSIWKAFGGITRDLGSFREETDKTTDLHQHFSRLCSQRLETASQDARDAITIHPLTASQESMTTSPLRQPHQRDVYVLDMTSSAEESCFFAKSSDNLNWLWHKRLAHLNFKTINKLAKQNLVIGLPSLVYSTDIFYQEMYNWVYFLKKKIQAPETIMSFIKRVENQNDIRVKQLRTDNGTEFRNSILVNFCDEKGIYQKISSPYTSEQNGVAERKNRTLIEAASIMLSASIFSKQYWTEAIATACYTQNKSTIVKRHLKTPYEFF
ncbi:retrovirus-related pol polyprotein from transposon TNT 1-94, partial [Tanacetum coccineum]